MYIRPKPKNTQIHRASSLSQHTPPSSSKPSSEGHEDTYSSLPPREARAELQKTFDKKVTPFRENNSLRKLLWMGGGALAVAGLGMLAGPALAGVALSTSAFTAVGAGLGATAGLVGYALQAPSPIAHDDYTLSARPGENLAIGLSLLAGTLTGALGGQALATLGAATIAPGVGAVAGLALGLVGHCMTNNVVEETTAQTVFKKQYERKEPGVKKRNLFSEVSKDPDQSKGRPQVHWLTDILGPTKLNRRGDMADPNFQELRNYAEEAIQGLPSLLRLEKADPKNPNDKRETGYARAFGKGDWRQFEDKLAADSQHSNKDTTREVYSNIKSLDKAGGRESLLKNLGFKEQFRSQLAGKDFVLSQLGKGGAGKPAVVNAKLANGDLTFFFQRADEAQEILESPRVGSGTNIMDDLIAKARLGLHPHPMGGKYPLYGTIVGGGHLFMAQSAQHDGAFRIHLATMLEKALQDMKDC